MEKKRILINAMMLKRDKTGLGVYAHEVLKRVLPKLSRNYQIDLICTDREYVRQLLADPDISFVQVNGGNPLRREWGVAKYVYQHGRNYDLYYSMSQHGFPFIQTKEMITVHDIMPRIYPKGRMHQFLYYLLYLPLVIRCADQVVTVSNSSKKDLQKYYGCKNAAVSYCGTNFPTKMKDALDWDAARAKRYIMVGIHYPYKNLHSVIELFTNDTRFQDRELIIIGNADNAYGQQLKQQVKQANAQDKIHFTGYVNEVEKTEYFNNAYALIFPTKYEGFGLPVLEGMAYGIPVVCSNTSSLPEVAGDAAIKFDPNDLEDMADKILMLDDAQLCHQLIARGYENIKRYTWENCAERITDVIKNVLK